MDPDLLEIATTKGINLSEALEDCLRERLIKAWQEESRHAIESHNRFIAEHGMWSKKYRSW